MSRRGVLFLGATALLAAGLTLAAVYGPPSRPRRLAELPGPGDVERMTARLVGTRVGFEPTPEFVVPAEHVPVILRWLQPGEYVPDPPIFPHDELGQVRVRTKEGRELHVRFFWAGKNPAVYTFDGEAYFWGNGEDEQGRWVDGGIRTARAVLAAYEASRR